MEVLCCRDFFLKIIQKKMKTSKCGRKTWEGQKLKGSQMKKFRFLIFEMENFNMPFIKAAI